MVSADRGSERRQADDLAGAAALREHLGELQLPQIAHGRRAIILFEGPARRGQEDTR